jgi:hypothetical protein
MIAHPGAGRGLDHTTQVGASAITASSKRSLTDSRQGEKAQWVATSAFAGFVIDMGSDTAADPVNQCVLPAGHTLDGYQISLISGPGIGSMISRTARVITGAAVIDMAISERNGDRSWGLQVVDSVATDSFLLGEFWVGERVEIANAYVQPAFSREYAYQVAEDVIGGRDVTLQIAPPRRRFSLSIRYVVPGTDDDAILEEVIANGRTAPFWYWTPDAADTGPYLVKLSGEPSRIQETRAPQAGIAYAVSLEMIEQTT